MKQKKGKKSMVITVLVMMLVLINGGTSKPIDLVQPNNAAIMSAIEQLNAAGKDFDEVWNKFTPELQEAVVNSLRISRIEESAGRNSSADASESGCYWAWVRRDGLNLVGGKVWSYYQQVDWCSNGTTITSKSRIRRPEVYMILWRFDKHIGDTESGGVGYESYRSWTQGVFSLCATPNVGCVQQRYPWVDLTVHADGTFKYSFGG